MRVSQLKQVPEWSLIYRVLLLQRTARTYRRHGMRCSGSTQEEATESLACAAGIVLGVPARAPDTLMRQTSQSVVKFPSIRQTAQPVRALAGPTVRPGLSRVRRRLVEERLRFSVVRAALFDPRTPAFWLSRLRFLALCAVLCRLSVRLQKSHSTPHGTPLHSTPGHSPTPSTARSMCHFLRFFLARPTQECHDKVKPRLGHVLGGFLRDRPRNPAKSET